MKKRKRKVCLLLMFLLLGCTACSDEKKIEQEQTKQEQQKETDVPKETDKPKKTDTPKETAVETPVMQEATKEPDHSKKEEKVELNHTYVTWLQKAESISCPTFAFDYSDNWNISSEELMQENFWNEKDVLENSRGVTITYTDYATIYGLGSEGRFMNEIKITKVADSSFVPGYPEGTDSDLSNLGEFMVAKIKVIGSLYMDQDEDFKETDGPVYYAVLPKSYEGTDAAVGMAGLYTKCTFEYPGLYSFFAESPDGKFTEEEEKEIIAIMSSFRVK